MEIYELIATEAVDIQRALLKRQVRDMADGAWNLAMGLRRQMNAMGADEGADHNEGSRQAASGVSPSDGIDNPEDVTAALTEVAAGASLCLTPIG